VKGSHSALPLRPGVLSSLLSYWARTTCHVTYSPDRATSRPGPPTSTGSRHYGVGHTTTVGATILTEPPPYRNALGLSRLRRARTEGAGADDFSLRPRPPSPGRRSTVVPYGSDGHGAARVEDTAGRARNGPLPESNRGCMICFGRSRTESYNARGQVLVTDVFVYRIGEQKGERCSSNGILSSAQICGSSV
jgi:hypothetical protein